jgi:hypothetical protein
MVAMVETELLAVGEVGVQVQESVAHMLGEMVEQDTLVEVLVVEVNVPSHHIQIQVQLVHLVFTK